MTNKNDEAIAKAKAKINLVFIKRICVAATNSNPNQHGDFLIEDFGGRKIVLKGVGKMFYESGYPIGMAIAEFKKQNIEVSILHVCDELLKNGFSPKTVVSKFSEDLQDVKDDSIDINVISEFCNVSYELQREMIFQSLFGISSKEAIDSFKP